MSGNNFVYFADGDPKQVVSPDTYVVKDCSPDPRNIFKTWEEGRSPNMVIETTSKTTKRRDTVTKRRIYSEIGVQEYFLYDPTGDYLKPTRLQGFRLDDGEYVAIEPDDTGGLVCVELGLTFRLDADQELRFFDRNTGKQLLTEAETACHLAAVAEQRASAAARRASAADERASAADQRASAAEDESRRLRELLKNAGIDTE